MNYVSFSVWGGEPYLTGAIKNIILTAEIYPKWRPVIYCGSDVPREICQSFAQHEATVITDATNLHPNGMFWRFLANEQGDCEHFIVRDVDSRLSRREADAVAEWVESGKDFHIMRDHPYHRMPIMGGMWGAKASAVKDMRQWIADWRDTSYGADQRFLARVIWPRARRSCLEHDSCTRNLFPSGRQFPGGCKFGDSRFVGERVSGDDIADPFDWQMRINQMHA